MTGSLLKDHSRYKIKKLQQLSTLLVEDDLLNAKLVSILFSQNGLNLQIADNGASAIEKIKANDFDIILMDMEMPVMNGYQATTVIRQQLKNNIPIIALTAHVLPGEREKCMAHGMNDYVAKPINPDLLFESIYNLTNGNKTMATAATAMKFSASVVLPDKVCNVDYLVNATRGNKKIIDDIVTVFFKETKKELVFLHDAIEQTNYTDISDISHKIKSAFSILGISVLEPVFEEMGQLSSIATPKKRIEQLNRQVNIVFKQARAEMKSTY